jgi:hypothetical protein
MIPKIKPLEWKEDTGFSYCSSVIGEFVVTNGGVWQLTQGGYHISSAVCRDAETAKSSALAYYEAIIRSTLE